MTNGSRVVVAESVAVLVALVGTPLASNLGTVRSLLLPASVELLVSTGGIVSGRGGTRLALKQIVKSEFACRSMTFVHASTCWPQPFVVIFGSPAEAGLVGPSYS